MPGYGVGVERLEITMRNGVDNDEQCWRVYELTSAYVMWLNSVGGFMN